MKTVILVHRVRSSFVMRRVRNKEVASSNPGMDNLFSKKKLTRPGIDLLVEAADRVYNFRKTMEVLDDIDTETEHHYRAVSPEYVKTAPYNSPIPGTPDLGDLSPASSSDTSETEEYDMPDERVYKPCRVEHARILVDVTTPPKPRRQVPVVPLAPKKTKVQWFRYGAKFETPGPKPHPTLVRMMMKPPVLRPLPERFQGMSEDMMKTYGYTKTPVVIDLTQ
jgi:hypothetical protein